MYELNIDNNNYYYLASVIYVKTEDDDDFIISIDKYETNIKTKELEEQIKKRYIYEFYKDDDNEIYIMLDNELIKINNKYYKNFEDILKDLNIKPKKINDTLKQYYLSLCYN